MLSRRTFIASAAALGAVGCGPLESLLSAPGLPKEDEITWAASTMFASLVGTRQVSAQEKYQQAAAALEEDTENPHGPRRGRYTLTLRHVEQMPKREEFAAWLNELSVDLVTVFPGTARALGEQGVLLPLDRFTSTGDPQLEASYFPSVLEQFRQDGALYGLPVGARPLMMYYDAGYFAVEGVLPVNSSWDWDDLVENAQKLTRRRENGTVARWGLATHMVGIWWALWQNGADVLNRESLQCRLQEPTATEALQFFRDLLHIHRVSPTESRDLWKLIYQPAGSPPAMVYHAPPMRPPAGDYRLASLPQGDMRAVPVEADLGIAIAARTARPEAAYTALKGLAGVMQQYVNVPAERGAVAQLEDIRTDLRPEEVAALQESMQHGRGWPQTAPQLHAMHTIVEALARGDEVSTAVNEACSIVREYQQA